MRHPSFHTTGDTTPVVVSEQHLTELCLERLPTVHKDHAVCDFEVLGVAATVFALIEFLDEPVRAGSRSSRARKNEHLLMRLLAVSVPRDKPHPGLACVLVENDTR